MVHSSYALVLVTFHAVIHSLSTSLPLCDAVNNLCEQSANEALPLSNAGMAMNGSYCSAVIQSFWLGVWFREQLASLSLDVHRGNWKTTIPVHKISLPGEVVENIIENSTDRFQKGTRNIEIAWVYGVNSSSDIRGKKMQAAFIMRIANPSMKHMKECLSKERSRSIPFPQHKMPETDILPGENMDGSTVSIPELPSPTDSGWILESGTLKPQLMKLLLVPKAVCSCKSCGCARARQKQCLSAVVARVLCDVTGITDDGDIDNNL